MTVHFALLCAVAAGGSAALLTGRMAESMETSPRSSWLRPHVPLAVLGGVGAGALAHTWAETLAFTALVVALALLFVVDLAEHRLPDAIVLPTYPILLVLLLLAGAVSGEWNRLGRALLAGMVLLTIYFVIAFAYPPGMGLGDVKLAGLLGLFLGWQGWAQVALGTLAAFLLNAFAALVLLAFRRVGRKGEVPFGPSMIIGAAVGAACGPLVLTGIA